MATTCGPATFICAFILILVATSLAIAEREERSAHASDDVALVRIPLHSLNHQSGVKDGSGRRLRRKAKQIMAPLPLAIAQFSLSLYSSLAPENPDLIFSPYSVHTALTMTSFGARGQTEEQMRGVLKLKNFQKQKAHEAYAVLTENLGNNTGKVRLNIANGVYVQPNLPIKEAFRTKLQNKYKAAFDHFDFNAKGGPESPINTWVSDHTEGKIDNLLSKGTIDSLTALIIVNAIYFKGGWRGKFNESDTRDQPFYRNGLASVTVPLMTRTDTYNYFQCTTLQAHVVELPYQDGRFSMFVILPTMRNNLAQVERALTLETLISALDSLTSTSVHLFLPRFKSESKFSLKDTMKAMGMTDAFNGKANFTGISSRPDLYISDVIHQANVEVTEEGTVAAAATAVVVQTRSSYQRPPPVQVRADHPFLYVILDNNTKTILFLGKYSAVA